MDPFFKLGLVSNGPFLRFLRIKKRLNVFYDCTIKEQNNFLFCQVNWWKCFRVGRNCGQATNKTFQPCNIKARKIDSFPKVSPQIHLLLLKLLVHLECEKSRTEFFFPPTIENLEEYHLRQCNNFCLFAFQLRITS